MAKIYKRLQGLLAVFTCNRGGTHNVSAWLSEFIVIQWELVRNRKIREVSVCTTIIDKDIVWYGAVNALGYATEEDNVIKVVDNKLANELLEVLLTS